MSRRRNRQRRAARREREPLNIHPPREPFDSEKALAKWRSILKTWTARGFTSPPFEHLVFGPVVHVDLHGADPPAELHDKTLAEVVRLTKQQPPS